MRTLLPFKRENEKNYLNNVNPVIRFILPFTMVVPFLLVENIYLIYTSMILTILFSLITRLKMLRILSRLTSVFPFIVLITIFIPLYVGNTIAIQIHIGITINIYKEGIYRAFLLFLRIFGSIFIFLSFFSSLTYSEFIEALTTLRIPSMFVGSLIIMLHYIPILAFSNKKILDAQELRGKKVTNYWNKLKAHAFIMGKSIVSNMERSEKLFESLKMRGFTGKLNIARRKVKILDILILTLFTSGMICFSLLIDLESFYMGVLELFLQ